MAKTSTLDTLVELAGADSDIAARRLGEALSASRDAEQRLEMLQQYRDEYHARFHASMAQGLTASGYRNFQLFLGKLDQAIAGQRQIVEQAQQRIRQERGLWQECERKRRSYDLLAARAEQKELIKEGKRDQKAMDEHAARQHFYKR
jgi:flagellar FliJ protein